VQIPKALKDTDDLAVFLRFRDLAKAACKTFMKLTRGAQILKAQKRLTDCIFLLGSAYTKAACRTLMKLTLGEI